ncbi:MAG: DNA-deoxyinosine glycosylase [Pseudomonadota bacterium]
MNNAISSSPISSFPPVIGANPHTLILGSMPGRASLEAQQYYAHPRNAFWPIMARLFDFDAQLEYRLRLEKLAANGILLWDVLKQCERSGSSLDSAIAPQSEIPNAIPQLLSAQPSIETLCFNGGKAWSSFRRHLLAQIMERKSYQFHQLPSTSPANARMNAAQKLTAWKLVLRP